MGFFDKIFGKKEKETLNEGLQKTKENFFHNGNFRANKIKYNRCKEIITIL